MRPKPNLRAPGALAWVCRAALVALTGALGVIAGAPDARACGGTPPPPLCGYTLVISKAAPGPLLLTGGGTFTLPVLVYFRVDEWPMGSGVCPTPPHSITVSASINCPGLPPVFSSAMFTVTSQRAFVIIPLQITLPPGPPRLCNVVGNATVTLSNGVVLNATGDTAVCIVEPSPSDPTVPRLDLQPLTPSVVESHPGDHGRFMFRITNNDPVESFIGTLEANSKQTSRLPLQIGGPSSPDAGPFAVSEPFSGDNFPIAWGDEMMDPCLPLPPDPHNPAVPTIARDIVLAPGESMDVELVTRSWGMCADGSCSEKVLVYEGLFSDGSPGFACTGVAFGANSDIMPAYDCLDGGAVTKEETPAPLFPLVVTDGAPGPGVGWRVDTIFQTVQALANGAPSTAIQTLTSTLNDEYARNVTTAQFIPPPPLFDSFFQVVYDIHFQPHPGKGGSEEVALESFFFVPGAPNGYAHLAPFAMGTASVTSINSGGFAVDSFFDISYQLSARAQLADSTQSVPIEIVSLELQSVGPNTVRVFAGMTVSPPASDGEEGAEGAPGPLVSALRITHDVRGFARPSQLSTPCPGDYNGDNVVDFDDLAIVLGGFGTDYDFDDLGVVLGNFGTSCP